MMGTTLQVMVAQVNVNLSLMGYFVNLKLHNMVQFVKNAQRIVKDAQDPLTIIVHNV